MSRKEQSHQLLERIDALLTECGKDPRRRLPSRPPARPAWRGPSWARDEWARRHEGDSTGDADGRSA